MLYLVATPIGNLEDITLRALRILKECDYILSEDTSESRVLLSHYEIKTPLRSFHKFNEKKSEDQVIQDLKEGKNIALISDRGTPLISDPGSELVERVYIERLEVTALPGPSSVINGYLLSGMQKESFQFIGFLSKAEKEREKQIKRMIHYPGSSVCFESPKRLLRTLKDFSQIAPLLKIAALREMTKKFEERVAGTPDALIDHFSNKAPKGEFVLVVEESNSPYEGDPEEVISLLEQNFSLSLTEAIKMAAHLLGVPKRELYQKVHQKKK